ncbi:CST complex subunit CTC1 [Trichoplax sp. H2]|nr:CST complex subunit CTC1 [Trichoplax sp. H2]|eukprot:RDD46393.1 CST complex subunit CTC1 [Trichoplax sp. H2]
MASGDDEDELGLVSYCIHHFDFGHQCQQREWLQDLIIHVRTNVIIDSISLNILDICKRIISIVRDWIARDDQNVNMEMQLFHAISIHELLTNQDGLQIYRGNSPLLRRRLLLLGYLTDSSAASTHHLNFGCLYLQDNTGAVISEIVHPNPNWLRNLILVPSWTFVVAKDSNTTNIERFRINQYPSQCYLEIIDDCIPLSNYGTFGMEVQLPNDRLMSVSGLQEIVKKKCNQGRNVSHVFGKITSKSQIFSTHGKGYFMIQLMCSQNSVYTPCLFKGKSFLHWHSFLIIGRVYVFTHMINVVKNKGDKNERFLLIATAQSTFFPYNIKSEVCKTEAMDIDEKQVFTKCTTSDKQSVPPLKDNQDIKISESESNDLSLSATLKERINTDYPATDNVESSEKNNHPCSTYEEVGKAAKLGLCVRSKCISYQGVISSYTNVEAGIYEIDNKYKYAGLYMCYSPCLNCCRGMRIGACIKMYHAHLIHVNKHVIGFCLCSQSSVEVVRFTDQDSPYVPFVSCCSVFGRHAGMMPVMLYDWFLSACEKLSGMFSHWFSRKMLFGTCDDWQEGGKILKGNQGAIDRFIHLLSNLKEIPYPNISRNFYDEFFNWPHRCHVTTHPYWPILLPSIASVSDVLHIFDEAINDTSNSMSNSSNWRKDHWHSMTEEDGYGWINVNRDRVSWNYQIISPSGKDRAPKVIVGCLLSSKKDGHLKLVDNTGEINCIVSSRYSGVRNDDLDQLTNMNIKFNEVDQLWIIRKYQLIIERLRIPNMYSVGNEFRYMKYIQFSINDACRFVSRPYSIDRLLSNFRSPKKASLFAPIQITKIVTQKDCQASESSGVTVKLVSYKKRLLYVKHKHASNSFDLNQIKRFSIGVQLFYGRKIAIIEESTKKMLATVEKCNLNGLKEITDVVRSGKINPTNYGQQFSVDIDLSSNSSAVIIFDDEESLSWYPFLEPGMFCYLCEATSKSDRSTTNNSINLSNRKRKLESQLNQTYLQNVVNSCHSNGNSENQRYSGNQSYAISSSVVNFNCNTMWLEHYDHDLDSILECFPKNDAQYIKQFREINGKYENFINIKDALNCTISDRTKAEELSVSNFSKLVSFQCIILSKHYCDASNSVFGSDEYGESLVSVLSFSSDINLHGPVEQTIVIKAIDLTSPNCIKIYGNNAHLHHCLGLLPGSIVTFHSILCKVSQHGTIYCEYLANSSVTLNSISENYYDSYFNKSDFHARSSLQNVPKRYLIDYYQDDSERRLCCGTARIECRLVDIEKLHLRLHCLYCDSIVIDKCPALCKSDNWQLRTEARCTVEDGTATAVMHIRGNPVLKLLQVSGLTISVLIKLALRTGELIYEQERGGSDWQRDHSNVGSSQKLYAKSQLKDYCQSPAVEGCPITLYCNRIHNSKSSILSRMCPIEDIISSQQNTQSSADCSRSQTDTENMPFAAKGYMMRPVRIGIDLYTTLVRSTRLHLHGIWLNVETD